jgi:hypothetical protein
MLSKAWLKRKSAESSFFLGISCMALASCLLLQSRDSDPFAFHQLNFKMVPLRPQSGQTAYLLLGLSAISFIIASGVYLNRSSAFYFGWKTERLNGIRSESGFAYTAVTNHPEISAHEVPSDAEVLENGLPMSGPANSLHEDIRKKGTGRYSFWHDALYFATSDNSDPTTNGRQYEIRFPIIVGRVMAYCFYLFPMGLFVGAVCAGSQAAGVSAVRYASQKARCWVGLLANCRSTGKRAVQDPVFYVPAALLITVFCITRLPFFVSYPIVGLSPDTGSYTGIVDTLQKWNWPHFVMRTPGYPIFLWLVTAVVNRWIAVVVAQTLLSLAAALLLTYAFYRMDRLLAIPVALAMCGFLGSSEVLIYDTFVLSESFFTSTLMIAVSALVLGLRDGRPTMLSIASGLLALVILIRPAGIYLIIIFLIVSIFLMWNGFHFLSFLYFAVPFPTILLLFCSYNYVTLQQFVISPFGEANLVGATVLFWETDPRLPANVNLALKELPASYARAGVTAEDFKLLNSSWNADLLYGVYAKAYNRLVWAEGWGGFGGRFGVGDYLPSRSILKETAEMAIRRHPKLYAKFVWTNLVFFFRAIDYRFSFVSNIEERARDHYVNKERSYDLQMAKEYADAKPPSSIEITKVDNLTMVHISGSAWRRLQNFVEIQHLQIFQGPIWCWGYFVMFALGLAQFVRFKGKHLGAFIVCILTSILLGAALLVSSVELALPRYSYPTQFIYYLAIAVMPLLKSSYSFTRK